MSSSPPDADESKKPDAATIDGLRGKRVAVTGKLNATPPGRVATWRSRP